MHLKYFVLIFFIIVILFVLYCHIHNIKKDSSSFEILQLEVPNEHQIQEILVYKQPTLFRQSLMSWDVIFNIPDMTQKQVNNLLKSNQFIELFETYLVPYSLLLSIGWNTSIIMYDIYYEMDYFELVNKHRFLIGQLSGESRILLASPNQKKFLEPIITKYNNNNNKIQRSSHHFWEDENNKNSFNKLEFIDVILREGNIIYIPKGWWYIMVIEEDGYIFKTYNNSLLEYIC